MSVSDDIWNRDLSEFLSPEPQDASGPVPWAGSVTGDGCPVLLGGVADVVPADDSTAGVDGPNPDAAIKSWVRPPGGERTEAIFVLTGSHLAISRSERVTSPVWLDLDRLVGLDALDDHEPIDGYTEVEFSMDDGSVIGAWWDDAFTEAVVITLQVLADRRAGSTTGDPGTPAPVDAPTVADEPALADQTALPDETAPVTEPVAPVAVEAATETPTSGPDVVFEEVSAAPAPDTPAPTAPANSPFALDSTAPPIVPDPASLPDPSAPLSATPGPGLTRSATLELEDVVYLGGYPGQSKRRKKCTSTMDRTGLEVSGPGDLSFRISWDAVKTVEVQNSDEARFRMNTKIHRDASALVVECEQGVTILLEARDCPTIALRSAIGQLMTDLPVVVV